MIFIDSNIPMYLIGTEHPHKREALTLLEQWISEKKRLVTNVEVLQEIMHRYCAIHRKEAIQAAFDTVYSIVDEIFDVTEADILEAKNLLLSYSHISARDALHIGQMKRLKIKSIFSFDTGFDQIPNIQRIPA